MGIFRTGERLDSGDVVTWSYTGTNPSVRFIPMKY